MTMVNNTINNEDTISNRETLEEVTGLIDMGGGIYNKVKIRLVRRGFILGLLTAVSVQSLTTIVILLIALT